LFLDEVGDMAPTMQARLLRVIQEGEIRPVGGESRGRVDVRLLTATNKDLQTEVAEGRFREDLFYRLQVLLIPLPPLRERPGDVPLLVEHFLEQLGKQRGVATPRIASPVRDLLERHPWPGNVRQLENALKTLVVLAGEEPIDMALVESDGASRKLLIGQTSSGRPMYSLERNEKDTIRQALAAVQGHRGRAAKLLGISRATIFRKIKEYGLS
jgi:DNA-binding NtrC family response regulator